MSFGDGLRKQETVNFIKAFGGQDTRTEGLDAENKAEIAQNCRFGSKVGAVTKRDPISYYNSTAESNPFTGVYRYYPSSGTEYLLGLTGTSLVRGNDSTGAFVSLGNLATLAASSGKRFGAVTYNDLALISTGYDNIMQTDGTVAWELGSCKAALATTGNITGTVIHDCQTIWDEAADPGGVTTSLYTKAGALLTGGTTNAKCAKFAITDVFTTGKIQSEVVTLDYHTAKYVHLWVYSTHALDAGDIAFCTDEHGALASSQDTNLGAVAANVWTRVTIDVSGISATDRETVISMGLKAVVDQNVTYNLYIDDIRYSNLSTGAYYYAVEFILGGTTVRNGAFSNTVTTTASSTLVNLTNIPLGPSATCTARKLYRTTVGTGTLKLVATYTEGTSTWDVGTGTVNTYIDNVDDAHLGAAYGAVTDDMPKGQYLHIAQERLFVTGNVTSPNIVYYSEPYLPHWILTADFDYIGKDDNDIITGMQTFLGNTYVIKQNSIRPYNVTGTPTVWSLGSAYAGSGAIAPWSIIVTPKGIVYQGIDSWYLFNGNFSTPIIPQFPVSTEISSARIDKTYADIYNGVIYASYTDAAVGKTYNDKVMIYDMIYDQLSIDKGGAKSSGAIYIGCIHTAKAGTDKGQIYATDEVTGHIYKYNSTVYNVRYATATDINSGTHSDSKLSGTESEPVLSREYIDNMEDYTTDALAQAAWVSTDTTASYDANTKLMMQLETTGVAETGQTITFGGSASINTTDMKFGAGCAQLSRSTSDYLSVPHEAWMNFGTGDFCLEGQFYWEDMTPGYAKMFTKNTGVAGHHWFFSADADGTNITSLTFAQDEGTSYSINVSASIPVADYPEAYEWHHYAVVKASNRYYFFLDYVLLNSGGTLEATAVNDTTEPLNIGRFSLQAGGLGSPGSWMTGLVDGIRVSDVARWTATAVLRTHAYGTNLQTYSESNIINEGTYALNIEAEATGSLNDTVYKTITSTDLSASTHDKILLDIYASRAGTNVSFGMAEAAVSITTVDHTADKFTLVGHGLSNTNRIKLSATAIPTGLSSTQLYYVVGVAGNDFQVALTSGGSAVEFSSNGTDVSFQKFWMADIVVTAADTWETLELDYSAVADASKNAITTLAITVLNSDAFTRYYVDNIRPAIPTFTWTSPILFVNASDFGEMYWNADVGSYAATVTIQTRNDETSAGIVGNTFGTALTASGSNIVTYESDGSTVTTEAAKMVYFQFRVNFTVTKTQSTNPDYSEAPFLYLANGYLAQFTYYRAASYAETAVEFKYKTGYRNLDMVLQDKVFKKIVSQHEGDDGNVTISYDIDDGTGTSYTFAAIALSTYSYRWESYFPSTAFGRSISIQWLKDDMYAFKIKQLGLVTQIDPIITA